MKFIVLKTKLIISVIAVTIAIVILALTLNVTKAYTVFYGGQTRKLPIYSVKTEDKVLAISFDCAWGTDYTDKLLSIMEEENVKCTFFMVEFWVKKHPDYVKKIFDAGHEIGTHSSTHPYMSKLDENSIQKELVNSSNAITEITGEKVNVFRPPYGDYNNTLLSVAEKLGLYTIQWSVDSLDWKNLSKTEIVNRVVSRVENGSIVLFHNQGLHTADALPEIIKQLKSKGYSFKKIGDLIYKDNYSILPDGTQTKNNV